MAPSLVFKIRYFKVLTELNTIIVLIFIQYFSKFKSCREPRPVSTFACSSAVDTEDERMQVLFSIRYSSVTIFSRWLKFLLLCLFFFLLCFWSSTWAIFSHFHHLFYSLPKTDGPPGRVTGSRVSHDFLSISLLCLGMVSIVLISTNIFQVWSMPAGYKEFVKRFEIIQKGEIFWMNNKCNHFSWLWAVMKKHSQELFQGN